MPYAEPCSAGLRHFAPTECCPNALLLAVVGGCPALPSINAATLLVGCAKLGRHPGPEVRQQCWEAVGSQKAVQSNPRGVSNAAWALAVLEVRCRAKLKMEIGYVVSI